MRALITLLAALPATALAFAPAEPAEPGWQDDLIPGVDLPDLREAPIIHGEPGTRDAFPMAGGMLFGASMAAQGEPFKLLMCSSTLIAPDVVLLAAHCVDLDTMLALYGMQNLALHNETFAFSPEPDLSQYSFSVEEWPAGTAFASEVVMHPDWDFMGLKMGLSKNFDIALMFLEEPVYDIPYAFLPTPEEDASLFVGQEVDIVGWGQQTHHQQPPPGTVGVKMVARSFIAEEAPFEFQVGAEASDPRKCHGDSGGPSFAYVETTSTESMRLVGVTSHAYDWTDCTQKGGVDTRVGYYLDWIDEEMRARCEDGSRAWCDWPGIIPPPDEKGLMAWEKTSADDEDEEARKACGCSATGAAAGWLPVLLGLIAVRRRR